MIAYISGQYSADTKEGIEQNIRDAEKVAKELWSGGITALCPHLNTAHFEIEGVTYEDYINGDLELVSRCDCIIMLQDWHSSQGAVRERNYAKDLGMPIYYYPETPIQQASMSSDQEKHLAKIIYRFTQDVSKKYRIGQIEHGGNLFDKPNLPMLMEEVQDLVVYAYTLKDQIQEASGLIFEDTEALNILTTGNKQGKIIKDIDKEE
jgi:hypothetical protein